MKRKEHDHLNQICRDDNVQNVNLQGCMYFSREISNFLTFDATNFIPLIGEKNLHKKPLMGFCQQQPLDFLHVGIFGSSLPRSLQLCPGASRRALIPIPTGSWWTKKTGWAVLRKKNTHTHNKKNRFKDDDYV